MRSLLRSDTHSDPFHPGTPSPLRSLVSTGDNTRYILIDPAHTFAIDGIGKDFLASTLVVMARAGHWGTGAMHQCLANAYNGFMAFCQAYKKGTSIMDFSYASLKLPNNSCLVCVSYISKTLVVYSAGPS